MRVNNYSGVYRKKAPTRSPTGANTLADKQAAVPVGAYSNLVVRNSYIESFGFSFTLHVSRITLHIIPQAVRATRYVFIQISRFWDVEKNHRGDCTFFRDNSGMVLDWETVR